MRPVVTKASFYLALNLLEADGAKAHIPVNGSEGSRGPLQIHKSYFEEAGIKGEFYRVDHFDVATRCCDAYLNRHAKQHGWSDPMTVAAAVKCARIHKGGPRGAEIPSTVRFGEKFLEALNTL